MLASHECSSWESASGKKTGRSEVRAILNSLLSGQRMPCSPPRKITLPNTRPGDPGSGRRAGEGPLGGRGQTELLKMAALEANNIAHLPGKTGAARGQRTGARATQRNHGETFSARADGGAQGQRLGGPPSERGSAAQRGRAPARDAQPPTVPGREPFPRVSKKCQILRILHPAWSRSPRRRRRPGPSPCPPAALPAGPAPLCVAAARRAPPGGVEPAVAAAAAAAARSAWGGRTRGCC